MWKLTRDGYAVGTESWVTAINKNTVFSAIRFVYASEKSDGLDHLVKKHKGSGFRLEMG